MAALLLIDESEGALTVSVRGVVSLLYGGSEVLALYGGSEEVELYGGSEGVELYGGSEEVELYGGSEEVELYGGSEEVEIVESPALPVGSASVTLRISRSCLLEKRRVPVLCPNQED